MEKDRKFKQEREIENSGRNIKIEDFYRDECEKA